MKTPLISLALCGVLALANTALADTKPKGAKPAPAQTIANIYAGKTQNWKSCKAGIYYGGGWEAQAYCDKSGPSVATGKWSVNSKGKLCHDLDWYWPQGDQYGTKKGTPDCISHVVDADGVIWRKWDGEPDDQWWQIDKSKSLVKGFKHKRKVNRLRKKLGV